MFSAVEPDSIEVVRYLVESGTDINHKDKDGKEALFSTVEFRYHDINRVKYLIDSGADINLKDKSGKNILVYATESDCDEEIIDYLKDLLENKDK